MVLARSRSTVASALLLASALALAACGSDGETSTSAAPAPAASLPSDTVPSETTPAETVPAETMPPETVPADTAAPDTTVASVGTIIDVATQAGTFTTLLAALDAAGLTDTVATGKYTLLAPTDDAFAALGQPAVDALMADPVALTALLQNHVLPLPQTVHTIGLFGNVVTLGGGSLPVTNDGTTVTVGGATITSADVQADNGLIQVIDAVLVPTV
jgi:transforming growth factor-beta-induced protein